MERGYFFAFFEFITWHYGKELLTADEVRLLNNEYAILFIRGEKAVMDKKYNILKHKNIKLTEDGRAESYIRKIKFLDKEPEYDFSTEDFETEKNINDIEILEF